MMYERKEDVKLQNAFCYDTGGVMYIDFCLPILKKVKFISTCFYAVYVCLKSFDGLVYFNLWIKETLVFLFSFSWVKYALSVKHRAFFTTRHGN